MRVKLGSAIFAIILLVVMSGSALASGFAIIEQSVSGLGNAFSGSAAVEDATTVFFNPAGMTLLEGQQVVAGTHVIIPSTKFSATTATNNLNGSLGTNNGGEGGVTKLVPNLYYTNKLNEKLAIGLGINAPFGLATKYDKDWVGRYHAVESDVMTININPAIAYKVTDKLSLGFGFNIEYMDATLSSMVDGGLVAFSGAVQQAMQAGMTQSQAIAAVTPTYGPLISNTNADIYSENTADDWGYGFNLGALYELSDSTRIGLAYRSEIKHKLEGEVKFDVPATVAALSSSFPNQNISGKIDLPASASVNIFHQMTDKLAVMADVTWTGWSSFDELVIKFEGAGLLAGTSSATDNSPTTENWDDTWRYSLGLTYQTTEALKLRFGVAFDETPISDEYRTPRIPGENRLWLALGFGYQFSENINVDFAYAHLFVDDSKMEKYALDGGATDEDRLRGNVVGEFENAVDIASLQLSYSF